MTLKAKVITTVITQKQKQFIETFHTKGIGKKNFGRLALVSGLKCFSDRVIDLTKQDLLTSVLEETGGVGVDYILEDQETSPNLAVNSLPGVSTASALTLVKALAAHGSWVTSRNIQVSVSRFVQTLHINSVLD